MASKMLEELKGFIRLPKRNFCKCGSKFQSLPHRGGFEISWVKFDQELFRIISSRGTSSLLSTSKSVTRLGPPVKNTRRLVVCFYLFIFLVSEVILMTPLQNPRER